MAATGEGKAIWHREIAVLPHAMVVAVADRIVTIPRIVRKSTTKATIWSFRGDRLDDVLVGVAPVVAARTAHDVIVVGEGRAARLHLPSSGVTTWRIQPPTIGCLAIATNVLASASYGTSNESVQWFDLSTVLPTRIARLTVTRKAGWLRCPYLLRSAGDDRWWLVSERRIALIRLAQGKCIVESVIDLPPDRIAGQAVFCGDALFALQTRGGYWQWRDGELRLGSSVITGGEPPQPEKVQAVASMFRVDLRTGTIGELIQVPTGLLIEDPSGVAVLAPGAIARFDQFGRSMETLPAPVPDVIRDQVGPMPYESDDGGLSPGPGEYLLSLAADRLLHLAWAEGIANAEARDKAQTP